MDFPGCCATSRLPSPHIPLLPFQVFWNPTPSSPVTLQTTPYIMPHPPMHSVYSPDIPPVEVQQAVPTAHRASWDEIQGL